jgi:non-specific serine/threonine protein kinase
LCGAAEALREITGAPVMAADRAEYDRLVGQIRRRLGEHSFAAEWSVGRTLSPDDAARLALRQSDAVEVARAPSRLGLTKRELEVASLVAQGLTNREAADRLLVAQRTVETHLEHIFAKLGVQTRAEVAAWAARQDVLDQRATGPL